MTTNKDTPSMINYFDTKGSRNIDRSTNRRVHLPHPSQAGEVAIFSLKEENRGREEGLWASANRERALASQSDFLFIIHC
jgi:hypothetical protein